MGRLGNHIVNQTEGYILLIKNYKLDQGIWLLEKPSFNHKSKPIFFSLPRIVSAL